MADLQLPEGLQWVRNSEANESDGVVTGTDESGSALLVSRVTKGSEVGTASVIVGTDTAKMGYYGKAHSISSYELLVATTATVRWVAGSDGEIPSGAVAAGLDGHKRTIYISRVRIGSVVVASKLIGQFRGAFAGWNEFEYIRRTYEVLCLCENEDEGINVHEVVENENIELGDNHTGELDDKRKEGIEVPEGLAWRYAEDGNSFDNAVKSSDVDEEGRELHVVRGSEKRELTSGVLRVGEACASIPSYSFGYKHECYEVLVNEGGVPLKWEPATNGELPDKAVQAGAENNGEPIWVARCEIDGAWVPGKLVPRTRRAYAAKDGIEYSRFNYEVLCVAGEGEDTSDRHVQAEISDEDYFADARLDNIPTVDGLEWVNCRDGVVPPYAIVLDGEADQRQFVARVFEENEIATGSVSMGKSAVVPYFQIAESNERYQVLVKNGVAEVPFFWVPISGANVPECALFAGISSNGEKIMASRVKIEGCDHCLPAKYRAARSGAYYAHDGKEELSTEFEVLCVGDEAGSLDGAVRAIVNGVEETEETTSEERSNKIPTYEGLKWVDCTSDEIPTGAVVLDGQGDEDSAQFVARVYMQHELTSGSVIRGAKAVIPYFGLARESDTFQVLVNEDRDNVELHWVPGRKGEVPDCAVQTGMANDGDRVFCCRKVEDGWERCAPGKVRLRFFCAYLATEGKEVARTEYEVLCIGAEAAGIDGAKACNYLL